MPSAHVLLRSCTRASWRAVTRAKARTGIGDLVLRLRQAGAFLLRASRTLPVTLTSVRAVTSPGAGAGPSAGTGSSPPATASCMGV